MVKMFSRTSRTGYFILLSIVLGTSGCESEISDQLDGEMQSIAVDTGTPDATQDGSIPDAELIMDATTHVDGATVSDAAEVPQGDAAQDAGVIVDAALGVDAAGLDGSTDQGSRAIPDIGVSVDANMHAPDSSAMPPDAEVMVVDAAVDRSLYPDGPYGLLGGEVIADLEFIGIDAEPYRLSDMRQEPNTQLIVLPVLVTWCPVCVRQMPALGVMALGVRNEGALTVLSIFQNNQFSPADHRDIAIFHRDHNPPFPLVADPDQVMAPYFQNFGRQKYLLINAEDMRIVHASEQLNIGELEERIRTWLDEHAAE